MTCAPAVTKAPALPFQAGLAGSVPTRTPQPPLQPRRSPPARATLRMCARHFPAANLCPKPSLSTTRHQPSLPAIVATAKQNPIKNRTVVRFSSLNGFIGLRPERSRARPSLARRKPMKPISFTRRPTLFPPSKQTSYTQNQDRSPPTRHPRAHTLGMGQPNDLHQTD
jgi:hypothetical protein